MDEQVYALQYRVEKEHWWYTARTRILLRFLAHGLNGRRNVTLLDIGCGTGALLEALAEQYTVTGLEPSAQAVDFCRARGLATVHQGTPESFAPEGPFDVVTMFDVLEHITDDAGTLRRVRGLVKPGGHLLLTVPAYRFLWSPHDDIVHHKRRYTMRSLRPVVEQAGFRVRHMTYFNAILFPAAVVRRLTARIVPERPLRDLELPGPAVNRLLRTVFGLERHAVPYARLPFGLSLLCWAEKESTHL